MKRCRAASTADEKAKHYINILLSSVEYETFVKLMKIMRPVAELRASAAKTAAAPKAEGKNSLQGINSPAKMSKQDAGMDLDSRAEAKSGKSPIAEAKTPVSHQEKSSSK